MFIVTVKSIDADSHALPMLYSKTTLQNYNFSMNPQEDAAFLVKNIYLTIKETITIIACYNCGSCLHHVPLNNQTR